MHMAATNFSVTFKLPDPTKIRHLVGRGCTLRRKSGELGQKTEASSHISGQSVGS